MNTIVKLSAILPLAFATQLAFSESCDRYADPNERLKCEKIESRTAESTTSNSLSNLGREEVSYSAIVLWRKGMYGEMIQVCLDPETYLQVDCSDTY